MESNDNKFSKHAPLSTKAPLRKILGWSLFPGLLKTELFFRKSKEEEKANI